ncbi:YwdI family protein [Sporosarcina sp. GW1-11]|uniref:YwdI family protein n=1 Tax=Sporosarcina sp. GW1-11 TaxID=2899126 RepID=UPI00294D484C|nr:YwdI family protein [Sporosarcina sp. GW1-11]MDV6379434.1 YwdI family protein [Sporosarcina sp. GW1-11]
MISSEQVLAEIEQQVHVAKQASTEQTRREAISAVRSLCNVVLNDHAPSQPVPVVHSSVQAPTPVTFGEQPLQEADANGESLFDF